MKNKNIWIFSAVCLFLVFAMAIPSITGHAQPVAPDRYPIQTTPTDLELIDVGEVVEILKSDTIRVGKKKTIYIIDNIRVPLELSMDARDYLEKNILGQTIGIYISGKDPNKRKTRAGHIVGHMMTQDGKWVQAEMVARGLAWVTSTPTSRDLVRTLYKYEALGRAQELGLWKFSKNMVKNDHTIRQSLNTFNVYEGVVSNTTDRRSTIFYINLGPDRNNGVTGVIRESDKINFILRGYNLFPVDLLRNQRLRIRGWVEDNGGPMFILTHPEQIELPDLQPHQYPHP